MLLRGEMGPEVLTLNRARALYKVTLARGLREPDWAGRCLGGPKHGELIKSEWLILHYEPHPGAPRKCAYRRARLLGGGDDSTECRVPLELWVPYDYGACKPDWMLRTDLKQQYNGWLLGD